MKEKGLNDRQISIKLKKKQKTKANQEKNKQSILPTIFAFRSIFCRKFCDLFRLNVILVT
uniref:Uncharacterized protein n=1 Tax=Romanomermis culicivorax TaxID=13658 RepID=A0A915KXQ3_ROMCU